MEDKQDFANQRTESERLRAATARDALEEQRRLKPYTSLLKQVAANGGVPTKDLLALAKKVDLSEQDVVSDLAELTAYPAKLESLAKTIGKHRMASIEWSAILQARTHLADVERRSRVYGQVRSAVESDMREWAHGPGERLLMIDTAADILRLKADESAEYAREQAAFNATFALTAITPDVVVKRPKK